MKKYIKDKPVYEVEYNKGEAYVDIPEEEIKEFIKKRLITIANSPRLIEKYRRGLNELLEEDLQEYANKQFYEEGKGEIFEDSADEEDNSGDVEISYNDLVITVWTLVSPERLYPTDYAHPDEYDEEEIEIEWDYTVDGEDIVTYFCENSEMFEELKDLSDDDLERYVKKHFEDLIDKYADYLREEYREDAREDAEENYEE